MAEKLSTLEKLMRLKSHTLDQRKAFVAGLVARLNALETEKQSFQDVLREEQQKASIDDITAQIALSHFSTAISQKMEKIDRIYKEASLQLEREKEKLAEVFKDYKVHATLLEKERLFQKQQLDRKEQKILDEYEVIKAFLKQKKNF